MLSEGANKHKEQVLAARDEVLRMLKPFQRDTVTHVDDLFRRGSNRVLVSDEVGLGKTLVAKGVVATTAALRIEEDDPFFKVVYVCSNSAIVNQNLSKLSIDEELVDRVDASQARLSMQHYFAYQNEREAVESGRYIQLIPMTPGTSFNITNGAGVVQERALIYAVLRHHRLFSDIAPAIEAMFSYQAQKSWGSWRDHYCGEVDTAKNAAYRDEVCSALEGYAVELEQVRAYAQNRSDEASDNYYIGKLRSVFARLSIDRLDPDLVIMDEFQRFRSLIDCNEDEELGLISKRFLFADGREDNPLRVLLLSATPFKAFTTQAEDELFFGESSSNDFLNVVAFLGGDKNPGGFRRVWRAYEKSLSAFADDTTSLAAVTKDKEAAERGLRELMARTERVGLSEYQDIVCDCTELVAADKDDIASHLTARKLFAKMEVGEKLPIDYVESCPFVLSYLKGYKSGDRLLRAVEREQGKLPFKREDNAKAARLWVQHHAVDNYRKLKIPNSRMRKLIDDVFETGSRTVDASSLLWVPASRPYYEVSSGSYADVAGFSKTLVFSTWTMVPRMMSTLISYEDERRSVWNCYGSRSNFKYFDPKADDPEATGDEADDERKLPSKRLRLAAAARTGAVLLMYPSDYLAGLVEWPKFASEANAAQLEKSIAAKIGGEIGALGIAPAQGGRPDAGWYLKALLLLERSFGTDPLELVENIENADELSAEDARLADEWRKVDATPVSEMGPVPDDLCRILAKMAIGSPAICAMRTYKKCRTCEGAQLLGYRFASAFLRRLNTPSATLAVEAGCSKQSFRSHWSRVLEYCILGNFQAVLDEYGHQIGFRHSGGFMCSEMIGGKVGRFGGPSTYTMQSQYDVDTLMNLRNRSFDKGNDKPMKMRTAFAAAFLDDEGGGSNDNRRENLRKAFNSPFRPFVLCSTSVGQEGLDFHSYCRKIVHWNLPSNPVDLEQREGRINRYESMAVRQNVAKAYNVPYAPDSDIWVSMFKAAEQAASNDTEGALAELVPHWGLSSYDPDLRIERHAYLRAFGKSAMRYKQLIDVLVSYRAVLGQPRQEELLEKLGRTLDDESIKGLFMDLSPFNYEHKDWEK